MDDVTICAKALVEAIQECSVYKDFEKAKSSLKEFPELKKEINEFRKRNFLLQNTKEKVDLYYEIENMQKEFADFRKNPVVAEYITTELAVCRLFQKINQDIMSVVDVDIDDFADELDL